MPWDKSLLVADRRTPGAVSERAVESVPWVPWDVGGLSPSVMNQTRAIRLAPVFAAARHITDNLATLPLQPYRKIGERREPMSSLPQLLRNLDGRDGREDLVPWLTTLLMSLTLRGNAVGLVTSRDGMGFPTGISWLPMEWVHVDDSMWPTAVWRYKGRELDRSEVVHIPWLTVPGQTLGLDPLEALAASVESGLGAQEFGSDWFANSGVPPATMKNTGKTLTQSEAEIISARLLAAIRRRRPLVYGADWDFTALDVPPDQAQFIETMKLSAGYVAAIYGLDPVDVGGEAANSLTYANQENAAIDRMHRLRPWMIRVEAKLSALLPELQYVRFNADATVRADTKTRHEVYAIGRGIGLYSVDELRALEDLAPLPNGEGQSFAPPVSPAPPPPETGEPDDDD